MFEDKLLIGFASPPTLRRGMLAWPRVSVQSVDLPKHPFREE
jgi:hypothetical protein